MAATFRTPVCDLLGCEVPVFLAGMGGVARWELAAAAANAGGYAQLGMVREPPELIEREVSALRAATHKPFSVNIIPAATEEGLLDRQIGTCLDLGIDAFTFFWDVVPGAVQRVKAAGAKVIHQVGTIEAARRAEALGADVLIAQGVEAGGHIHGETAMLPLVEAIVASSELPVIASGGIATGAGLVAALSAGAQGVQIGTAFLATIESFAHDYHKSRVVSARATDTLRTDLFVLNWPAHSAVRVIGNSTTADLGFKLMGHNPDELPREVIAWEDQRPIYRYSTDSPLRVTTGNLEPMALFAGQGVDAITDIPTAGDLVRKILTQAELALDRLSMAAGLSCIRDGKSSS